MRAEKYRTKDPEERKTFDLAISQCQANLDQLLARQAHLSVWVQRSPGFARWGSHESQSSDIAVRRAWLRQYVHRVHIDKGRPGGHTFDTERISIEWLYEPYVPTDPMDYEIAEQWRISEELMPSRLGPRRRR